MADGAVGLGEGPDVAEHRVRHHDEQRHHPRGGDDAVGVGASLPRPRLQRVADGAVPLDGDGYEAEGGDADGDACGEAKDSEAFREMQVDSWLVVELVFVSYGVSRTPGLIPMKLGTE